MMVRILLSAVSILFLSTTVFGMHSSIKDNSLESLFDYLCNNITGRHSVGFDKDFSQYNNELIFNVIERKAKSLEDLAKDLLTNKDISKIMTDSFCRDHKKHSHFFIAAQGNGQISTHDLIPLNDGSGYYQRGDSISVDLYLTLNVILRVADQLKSAKEQGETFTGNYNWLKNKLENECVTYTLPMLEKHLTGKLKTVNPEKIIKIFLNGVRDGKIDEEWLVDIVSQQ